MAARQGGVVCVAQLHAAGLGRGAIHTRALAGRLVRVHRGVYAVGHAQLTALGWRWAGVLARTLRAAVATLAAAEPDITRTVLEERFLALVLNAQLPRPEVNAIVGPFEVDFLWRAQPLAVETDGAATHLTPTAFEEDRHRDAVLSMMGFTTLRFTWRQVVYEPRFVAKAIATALAG